MVETKEKRTPKQKPVFLQRWIVTDQLLPSGFSLHLNEVEATTFADGLKSFRRKGKGHIPDNIRVFGRLEKINVPKGIYARVANADCGLWFNELPDEIKLEYKPSQ